MIEPCGVCCTELTAQQYRQLYGKLSQLRLDAVHMSAVWDNGTNLERLAHPQSPCGQLLRLNDVCWLDVSGTIPGGLIGGGRDRGRAGAGAGEGEVNRGGGRKEGEGRKEGGEGQGKGKGQDIREGLLRVGKGM